MPVSAPYPIIPLHGICWFVPFLERDLPQSWNSAYRLPHIPKRTPGWHPAGTHTAVSRRPPCSGRLSRSQGSSSSALTELLGDPGHLSACFFVCKMKITLSNPSDDRTHTALLKPAPGIRFTDCKVYGGRTSNQVNFVVHLHIFCSHPTWFQFHVPRKTIPRTDTRVLAFPCD